MSEGRSLKSGKMHCTDPPPLTPDDIDDLLYLARVNESQELHQLIDELSQKYKYTKQAVLSAAIDTESGNTILHYCSANGFAELLQSLLSTLKTSNEEDGAVEDGDSVVSFINTSNKQGNTALHWAAYNGQLEAVKTLIGARADMWVKNAAGQVALYEAERADKRHVILYLLEAGMKETRENPDKVPSARDIGFANPTGEATPANGDVQASGSATLQISETDAGEASSSRP